MSTQEEIAKVFSRIDADELVNLEKASFGIRVDLIADAVIAAGWRPPARVITTVEELEALPNNEERAIPQEAVEAAEKKIFQAITGFVHEHKTISSEELTKDALTAALPAIEKEIRAQVAAELRGELPVQLAETAESDTGWLYDMSDWGPCPSEGNEHVDFRDENGFSIGSIDLHHIAETAALLADDDITKNDNHYSKRKG